MCDIGFCVAKIIRGNEYDATPCMEACNFRMKEETPLDKAINELETVELKTEGIMFDGMIKDKRKQ